MKEYTTALYIRLSQEDDNAGESNSVKNQRDLLTSFAMKHPHLSKGKLLYFVDDGYSGTSFDRPAVQNMLKKVREGKINCIAVKDFSRFGRNYIEVGGYLEQVFPFLGVRFLSVNDHFDSSESNGSSIGIEVGFKALIHDLYSRDLSVKIKSGKLMKTLRGEHVARAAPFGYVKSKAVKNAWEIDEAAAVTVRRIYDMALSGETLITIARTLNSENVPTPSAHRENTGMFDGVVCNVVDKTSSWRSSNVSRILRDERYTGKLIAGKKSQSRIGDKKTVFYPESDWIVVPDAHEPIITQEAFDAVQALLRPIKHKKIEKKNAYLFAGKLFCGHCRHALKRYNGQAPRYVCRSSMELGGNCLPGAIYESAIAEAVLTVIKAEIGLAAIAKKKADKQSQRQHDEREQLSTRIKRLSADVLQLKSSKESLFEDYIDKTMTKEIFLLRKTDISNQIRLAETEIIRLSSKLDNCKQDPEQDETHSLLSPYIKAEKLTPEMIALVNDIYVYGATHIEICFAFSDTREKALQCLNEALI